VERVVAVEQVFGDGRARRHAAQLLQFRQRLAQVFELGAPGAALLSTTSLR
jgi:hypothetical protein